MLLVHGWPDTHALWDHQVAALSAAGYRTIAPDLRGFGASDKPEGVEHYAIPFLFARPRSACSTTSASNACTSSATTGARRSRGCSGSSRPTACARLTALSVGHPGAFSRAGMAQREKSWYMLLFQFVDVAEQWLMQDGWRELPGLVAPSRPRTRSRRGLADPADLTATLNLYRANVPPEALRRRAASTSPPITVPVMGVWSDRRLGASRGRRWSTPRST